MNDLVDDPENLLILQNLVNGTGVDVNISELARILNKHRNTISNRVDDLFAYGIIDEPFCHLQYFQDLHPLMVIEKGDFIRDSLTNHFIETDPYIEAAYFFKEEEYNTLLIEYHKDLNTYLNWKEMIEVEGKITQGDTLYPSEAIYLSTKSIIKYDTAASISVIADNYQKGNRVMINGLELDEHYIDILRALLQGKGLKINETELSRQLDLHRKTIKRRISKLIKNRIISSPVCRFPGIWVPPMYFLVISMVAIKKRKEVVLRAFKSDPHVSLIIKTNKGHFNVVLFSAFDKMADHLAWQEDYDMRFPGCLGAVRNTYLSPAMTFSISQQYIYLKFISDKIKFHQGSNILKRFK